MSGVRIVTDSACDLPAALVAELAIEIVPLTIRFGDDEFVDRKDLSPAEFWSRCASSAVCTNGTSSVWTPTSSSRYV